MPAVSDHPYLVKKGIQAHGAKVFRGSLFIGQGDNKMDCNGALIIPSRINGKLSTLQFINEDGEKRLIFDGEKGWHVIGKITPNGKVGIAEGFATAASIHESTGYPVVVCFDAGNMQKVAEALRLKMPDAVIVLCADDDSAKDDTGLKAANKSALAVGGLVAVTSFNADKPEGANDFNDMMKLYGKDAVKLAIDAAKPPDSQPDATGRDSSPSGDGGKAKARDAFAIQPVVQMTCASQIKPEAIRWLWNGWLARGKFHIFAGQAGTGKTTISIALAATISTGGRFPDGSTAPAGNVLIWSGEDSAQDTLVPRLIAAGANTNRIHFIGDVRHGDEVRSFDPATDINAMLIAAAKIGDISLLIVDPVVNAVAGDSHKNGEVRRALQPLVEFGEKLGCAVLGITHFSKGTGGKDPMERVTGSLAFAALARVVLATGKINDNGTVKHIFCRAKSNIGKDSGGFEYELHQKEIDGYSGIYSSYAAWGQAVDGTATELLTESAPDDGEGAGADQFLRELLKGVVMPQKEAEAECKSAGYSLATIKRSKKRVGVISKKSGMANGWNWRLPDEIAEEVHEGDEEAHINCVNPFGKNEPLREK